MTVAVALSKGYVALIDDEDADLVTTSRWCVRFDKSRAYAIRRVRVPGRRGQHNERIVTHMHRLIMNAPAEYEVDHINGDGLDNRRSNLRLATTQQNSANRGRGRNNKSGWKGVSVDARRPGRYRASITANRKTIHLGTFDDPIAAALTYDAAALEFFGEFASLNRPDVRAVES